MSDKLLLVSSDGHATPKELEDFRPFVDPRYRDEFDDSVRQAKQVHIEFDQLMDPVLMEQYWTKIYESGAIEGQWDPEQRTKVLAREGVVAEVFFPDGAPFSAGGLGPNRQRFRADQELAGARAYNRWVEEFVSGRPYLGAQACIAIDNVAEAVKDVYWAKEHGMKGIYMPANDFYRPGYWDPRYEPFWKACEETQLPLHFHGGSGFPEYEEKGPDLAMWRVNGTEFGFYAHRPLWILIWSGVLERHPELRLVFTEQHCDWVAEAVAKMDWSWSRGRYSKEIRKTVPMLPSEYFARQVWLGASLLSRGELLNRKAIGDNKMMFGIDFPHPEGTWGLTREWLRATVAYSDMSEPEIRAFLGETAAAVYGFDVEALAPAVEEHGLSLEEISTPLPQDVIDGPMFDGTDAMRPTISLTQVR